MKLRQILISAKLICQYRALRRYIYIAAVEAIFFGIFPKLLMESQKNGVFGNNLLNWSAIVLTGATLLATIYFFDTGRDNEILVNVRPSELIEIDEKVIQKLRIEIKSKRDQIYLDKITLSDPLNRFLDEPVLLGWTQDTEFSVSLSRQVPIYSLRDTIQLNVFIRFPKESTRHFLKFYFSDSSTKEIYLRCSQLAQASQNSSPEV